MRRPWVALVYCASELSILCQQNEVDYTTTTKQDPNRKRILY